jgi:hypothetical protein
VDQLLPWQNMLNVIELEVPSSTKNKQQQRKNKVAINIEYMKACIRGKVEPPFRIITRKVGFVKARYKGLLKTDNQLTMLFTWATLCREGLVVRQRERSQRSLVRTFQRSDLSVGI